MADDDEVEQRIDLAIRAALQTMLPSTEIDVRAMARWLQTEFPGTKLEVLVEQVERQCKSLAGTAGSVLMPTPVNRPKREWPPPPSDRVFVVIIGLLIGMVAYHFVIAEMLP